MVNRGGDHRTRYHHPDRLDELPRPEDVLTEHTIGEVELIGVHGLSKTFHQRSGDISALVSVDLGFAEGETLGLAARSRYAAAQRR